MEITYSDPKDNLVRSGKGLITSMVIKTIGSSNKNKNSGYSINDVSMKDISKIIKEFQKVTL